MIERIDRSRSPESARDAIKTETEPAAAGVSTQVKPSLAIWRARRSAWVAGEVPRKGSAPRSWVEGAVSEHVIDRGQDRGGDGADRLLGSAPAAQTLELRLQVAGLSVPGGPGTLDQGGLEPGRALTARIRCSMNLPMRPSFCGTFAAGFHCRPS